MSTPLLVRRLHFILLISTLLTAASEIKEGPPLINAAATVPAYPAATQTSPAAGGHNQASSSCTLDLSDELFGGVAEACGDGVLDRSRCCPVLAAWLFAAHSRSALLRPPPSSSGGDDPLAGVLPSMPDSDSEVCAAALQTSLEARQIHLPRPNSTCDTAVCFCGIRLHDLSSLSCPDAFAAAAAPAAAPSPSAAVATAAPKPALRALEHDCRNASYSGCSHCLHSLEKINGGGGGGGRERKMMRRDCQLMGLTWLLSRNKTEYIPTVSAVLRAVLYSAHGPNQQSCSPDQENMPLAVDALQQQRHKRNSGGGANSAAAVGDAGGLAVAVAVAVAALFLPAL